MPKLLQTTCDRCYHFLLLSLFKIIYIKTIYIKHQYVKATSGFSSFRAAFSAVLAKQRRVALPLELACLLVAKDVSTRTDWRSPGAFGARAFAVLGIYEGLTATTSAPFLRTFTLNYVYSRRDVFACSPELL